MPPPPPRDRLDVFMAEASRRLCLDWRAHQAIARDPDMIVFVGRAAGRYDILQHGLRVSAAEIEREPSHVLERLQHAERQLTEAVEYQQLVFDAMQEMRDAERATVPTGTVWRPADLDAPKRGSRALDVFTAAMRVQGAKVVHT